MPNWNSNYLTVKGFTPAEQSEFKEKIEAEELLAYYHPCPDKDNGYEWQCENWGTKWDISDPVIGSEDSEFTCYFSTAWSPPVAAFEEISKRFPNATFELCYEEQGCDFTGAARFKSGVVEEFDGLPPSELQAIWLQENHPELVGNEDTDEVWELWSDAYGEVVEKHLAELLGSEPLSADVIQARKESEEQAKDLFERMLQDLKAKQTA